jgi:transketolase
MDFGCLNHIFCYNCKIDQIIYCLFIAWAEAGLFPTADLLKLRKIDSDLEGHPTPRLNFIDVGTGSLGQGLSVAAGMAYVGKNYDKASYRLVPNNFHRPVHISNTLTL